MENIDLVLKDKVHEKYETKSHYFTANLYYRYTKWQQSTLSLVQGKKYNTYDILYLFSTLHGFPRNQKKEKVEQKNKKDMPCARQKLCARGPEPYNFFTSPISKYFSLLNISILEFVNPGYNL